MPKRHSWLLTFLVLLVGCLLFACSGSVSNESARSIELRQQEASNDSDSAWYNSLFFRPFFGDFGEAELVEVRDVKMKTSLIRKGKYLTTVSACGRCHGDTQGSSAFGLADWRSHSSYPGFD